MKSVITSGEIGFWNILCKLDFMTFANDCIAIPTSNVEFVISFPDAQIQTEIHFKCKHNIYVHNFKYIK